MMLDGRGARLHHKRMTKSEQIPHCETPEHIALCVIGPDRAQWQRVADMTWSPGYSSGRRLAPHDFAADLPPRWSRALLGLARGLGVGAVMHNANGARGTRAGA